MSILVKNINIVGFRGIKNLNISEFKDINLFLGENNACKTSVLEALDILVNPDKNAFNRNACKRGNIPFDGFGVVTVNEALHVFRNFKEGKNIASITGDVEEKKNSVTIVGEKFRRDISISELQNINSKKYVYKYVLDNGYINVIECRIVKNIDGALTEEKFIIDDMNSEFAIAKTEGMRTYFIGTKTRGGVQSFRKLTDNKLAKELTVNILKMFDNKIKDIRLISNEGIEEIVFDVDGEVEYLPLSLYGDGMYKTIWLLDSILQCKDGALFVDEFETSFHGHMMSNIFRFMIHIADLLNVQLFLTTHSKEALDNLLETCRSVTKLDNINIIRLKRKDEDIFSKSFSGREAYDLRSEYDMELRA